MTDTGAFAEITGSLDYPMFVVTTTADGENSGCLVGFATQTGISPPRFLAGISQTNHTHGLLGGATHLAVHLLNHDQHDIADLFGSRTGDDVDKFSRCAWTPGPYGLPILDAAPAWFAGPILRRTDLGDHTGVLIAPDEAQIRQPLNQLLFFTDVTDLEPGHPS